MSYPVGTICIGQNFVDFKKYNGMEIEIISPCERQLLEDDATGEIAWEDAYGVRAANGDEFFANHPNLRLKRHDDEDKEASLRAKDRSKVSTLISTCKAAAEKALAKREKV